MQACTGLSLLDFSAMPSVELCELKVKRGEFQLGPASLCLESGSCLVLLGENGSGKSTVISALSRDIPIERGEIKFDNQAIQDIPRSDFSQFVSMMPQGESPGLPFSVQEIVMMGRTPFARSQWESQEDIAATQEALELCELNALKDRPIQQVSGGEKQRALLARVIVQKAQILLLDEPTASLDIRHHDLVTQVIQTHVKSGGTAIVSTHDFDFAESVGDQFLILKQGQSFAQGRKSEIFVPERLSAAFNKPFTWLKNEQGEQFARPVI